MGAKMAAPEKLAVAFMGDAAFGMNAMDLETAVRENIPVLAIVMNNSWMSTYSKRIPEATKRYKVGYMCANYTDVARGLGCHGERIDRPGEIVPALKRAIAATENGPAGGARDHVEGRVLLIALRCYRPVGGRR